VEHVSLPEEPEWGFATIARVIGTLKCIAEPPAAGLSVQIVPSWAATMAFAM
jgi:hypothetical protein